MTRRGAAVAAAVALLTLAGAAGAARAAGPFKLTIRIAGSGKVEGVDPACRSVCVVSFPSGAAVELSVTPDTGWTVAGWSGDCSGLGSCALTMTAAHAVYASLRGAAAVPRTGPALTLTISIGGEGTVADSSGKISCTASCATQLRAPQVITLTATPASGYSFSGWGGSCTGSAFCTVSVSQGRVVTAVFQQLPRPSPSTTATTPSSSGGEEAPAPTQTPTTTSPATTTTTSAPPAARPTAGKPKPVVRSVKPKQSRPKATPKPKPKPKPEPKPKPKPKKRK